MKIYTYIFIILFCLGCTNINAKTDYAFTIPQFTELNKHENNSKEKSPVSIINTKNYPSSNKFLSEKKIRQRGLVTICYLIIDNNPLLIDFFSKKLIFASQTFNFLRLFLGNEKRGPPVVLAS